MHKKIKETLKQAKTFYIDKILIAIALLLMLFFRQDILLVLLLIITLGYIHISKRDKLVHSLGISFSIAFLWMIISKNEYNYANNFISVFGISIFPLFAWTLGIFALYLLYLDVSSYLKKSTFTKKLLIFIGLYWPLLIIAETLGHHFAGITNITNYPGLPICDCLHAVWWMKIAYFTIGIIFFIINYYLIEKRL